MKALVVISLIFLTRPLAVSAQFNAPALIILPEKADGRQRDLQTMIDGEYILGTPYVFNNWTKATVTLKNGNVYTQVLLKYDAYRQTPVYLSGANELEITDPVKEFTMTADSSAPMRFVNADEYGKRKSALFYEVLAGGGKGQLLKAHHIIVHTTDRIINSSNQKYLGAADEYFYYDAEQGKVSRIVLSSFKIKEMLKLTPAQESDLHYPAYNFSDEADLLNFFKAYLGN